MKPALALLSFLLLPLDCALGWDVSQRKDPLSGATLVSASASAKSEGQREPHTLKIVLTRPTGKSAPTVDLELTASGRTEKIALPTEAAAAKTIDDEFARLEQTFKAVWYAEPKALRTQMVAEARQLARLRALLAAEKQVVFSSLASPSDSVAFALDSGYSSLRKQLTPALEAHELRREEQTAQLRRIEALLKRKQEHADLVAQRRKKAETHVTKSRARAADSGQFKDNLADAVLAALSEIALPSGGFSGKCTIEVRQTGSVRIHQNFRPDLPEPVVAAFTSGLAGARRAPEGVYGRFFECDLSLQNGDLGLNIAEVDPPAAADSRPPPPTQTVAPPAAPPRPPLPLDLSRGSQ